MRLLLTCGWTIGSLFALVQLAKAGDPAKSFKHTASPFLVQVGENLYFTPANCCGLVAAYMVANDLGHPVALGGLARQLPVTSAGTSMHDLETFFQECSFDTAAVEVETAELYAILERHPRLRAIALVRPAHWITLFSAGQGKFDCFSYPERADLNGDQFDRFFAKRAILIGPSRGTLDFLRKPSPFGANPLLFPALMGLIAGLIALALFVFGRRIRRSTTNRCSAGYP